MAADQPREDRDYAFYADGGVADGSAVLRPLRRFLRRVQQPWFNRQAQILYELRESIDKQDERIVELHQLIADLRVLVEQADARDWDQVAFGRRLAALEDAVAGAQQAAGDPPGEPPSAEG